MKSPAIILASPVLCLGILAGLAVDNAHHVRPQDAAPYHARVKAAVDAFPYVIGYWTGSDEPVPTAAVDLLRPNVIVSRRYKKQAENWRDERQADLLIVQCADSRDMTGHYPPICYPASGEPLISQRPFALKVGNIVINGTEYLFDTRQKRTGMLRKSVYNFFVVPGRGIVADIGGVRAAASDYQRRCFGAGQFQVVIENGDLPPEERDEIFKTLIGSDVDLIGVMNPWPIAKKD
jgi:hypothetical protein